MKQFQITSAGSVAVLDGQVEEVLRYPVAAEVDVVVAGGGPAGIGAAIGAARQGARTLLVERNGFLGGTATAVQMASWNMTVDRMTGYAQEITRELIQRGGAVGGGVTTPIDPEAVKRLAAEHVMGSGVELLLHSMVAAPLIDDSGRLCGIAVENKSGRQALLAKTVVDCTGDADVAARAGARFVMGRESDSKLRPMTVLVRIGGIDFETMAAYVRANPDEFDQDTSFLMLDLDLGLMRISGFFSHAEAAQRAGELDPKINYLRFEGCQVDKGIAFLNSVRIYHVDGTNAFDLTRAEIEARGQIDQLVAFIKARIPGCAGSYVIDTSSNMGVRETRRIVGTHTLTEEEIARNDRPDDTIARLWRYRNLGVEGHSPDPGLEGSKDDFRHRAGVNRPLRSFHVPYGCLVPEDVDGLLVAGRSLSTTHAADEWTRGMYLCMVTGQAAGVAAAISADTGLAPRDIDIDDLQRALAAQNVDLGDEG